MEQQCSARDTAKRLMLAHKGVSEFSSSERRRSTVLTLQTKGNKSVSYFLSIFFVSAFLCFFLSCLHSCLLRLSITSSLLPHGFNHSSWIFQQVERKLKIWVFVLKQLLTLFHPEEWGTALSKGWQLPTKLHSITSPLSRDLIFSVPWEDLIS